jgi:carboxyl-terminal processing protease
MADTIEMSKETRSTVNYLETYHYSKINMAQMDQRDLLRTYMTNLDSRHLYLLQNDVNGFEDKYAPVLVTDVRLLGDLSPAYDIFEKFRDAIHARVAWINKYLDGDINLQGNDTFRPDRSDGPASDSSGGRNITPEQANPSQPLPLVAAQSPATANATQTDASWPATPAEADQLWDKQIRYDVINELLASETQEIDKKAAADAAPPAASDKNAPANSATSAAAATSDIPIVGRILANGKAPADTTAAAKPAAPKTFAEKVAAAKEAVRKSYNSLLKRIDETDALDVQDAFLNTLANQYDPHSTFFTDNGLKDFDTLMSNDLIGIGCELEDKDDDCVVGQLVPGGPAAKSNKLHPGDKIIAVGQATGDLVEVDGIKLNNTVSLIRGAEDTAVRLKVVPAGGSEADAQVITLQRKKIPITTALAKAKIIAVPSGNLTVPIGVIELPAFYGKVSEGDKFSTTEDVRELIGKLKAAGVHGLVLDVRNNGGGFLNEAIDLAGLFIPPSPILRVRTINGFLTAMNNAEPTPLWDGPLIVLENKQSASATEIMAGALQDYRRALIVGDRATHGKGTVQQIYSFTNVREPTEKGAAKITMEKWYLPDGNSVQSRGVKADIPLPSDIDFLPIGEGDMKNALPWDSIPPLALTLQGDGPWHSSLVSDDLIAKLQAASNARLTSLEELTLLEKRVAWEKAREAQKDFSLNFDTRMAERRKDIAFRDELNKDLKYLLAKQDYKPTEILLDAAHIPTDGEPAITSDFGAPPPDDDPANTPVNFDIQLRESLRIMSDWLTLDGQLPSSDTTAKVAAADANAPANPTPTGTADKPANANP